MRQDPLESLVGWARGEWDTLFRELCPELDQARRSMPTPVRCPVCGDEEGFYLPEDMHRAGVGVCRNWGAFPDGFALLQWLKGWTFDEMLPIVSSTLQIATAMERCLPLVPRWDGRSGSFGRERCRVRTYPRIYLHAESWHGDFLDASVYLRACGLSGAVPPGVFIRPRFPYYESKQLKGIYPALVTNLTDIFGLRGRQFTYLNEDCTSVADVAAPRRLLASWRHDDLFGARLPLSERSWNCARLSIAESLEVGLAVYESTGLYTWATLSPGLLWHVPIPSGFSEICIWADNDRSGRGVQVAERLASRLHGTGPVVRLIVPPQVDTTWVDVMNAEGRDALVAARKATRPWHPLKVAGKGVRS